MKNKIPNFDEIRHVQSFLDSLNEFPNIKDKGLRSEVALFKALESKKIKLIAHRYKTKMFEVDLVLRSKKGKIHLIEVKSISHKNWIADRISKDQSKRLERALTFFQNIYKCPVQLDCAFVTKDFKITYIENFLV